MRKFLKNFSFFLLFLYLLSTLAEYIADEGLRKSEDPLMGSWNKLFEGNINANALILGSSRAQQQFNPHILSSRKTKFYNLGIKSYNVDMHLFRLNLFLKKKPAPYLVVLSLDYILLDQRKGIFHKPQFFPFLKKDELKEFLKNFEADFVLKSRIPLMKYKGQSFVFFHGLNNFFSPQAFASHKGFAPEAGTWNNDFIKARKKVRKIVQPIYNHQIKTLEELIYICKKHNIRLILVFPPQYYQAKDFVKNHDQIVAIYSKLANKHRLMLLDFSKHPIAYDTIYFKNSQHLNSYGADKFSSILKDSLKKYIKDY